MATIKTIRKIPWQGKKPDKALKGTPLNYSAGAAERYFAQLRPLILKMSAVTQKELKRLFKEQHAQEYFAQDASVSSQSRILMNALSARFDDMFGLKAKGISENVADQASKTSAAALKISLKEISEGFTLKTDFLTGELNEILNATVAENVGLIKSIAAQYLTAVQGSVMRSITTGNGLADLVPFLNHYEGVTLRRARLIAHDQTRKAFSNINRARMDKIGIKQFEWLHSAGGQVPRKLHVQMSGNIYSMDDPPVIDEKTGQRGFPGQLINCRCRMIPVINFDGES